MAGRKKTEGKNAAKESAKNLAAKAALYTLGLVVAAVAIIALSSLAMPGVGDFIHGGPSAFGGMMGGGEFRVAGMTLDTEDYFLIRVGLSVLNFVLVVYLIFVYVMDYIGLRSSFTLGIIAFLFSFLMYSLFTVPLLRDLLGPYGAAGALSFVPMLFSALGLLIFAKLSND